MDKINRDTQIQSVIKSNLISFGLTPEQIDKITSELRDDIIDILNNYEEKTCGLK